MTGESCLVESLFIEKLSTGHLRTLRKLSLVELVYIVSSNVLAVDSNHFFISTGFNTHALYHVGEFILVDNVKYTDNLGYISYFQSDNANITVVIKVLQD